MKKAFSLIELMIVIVIIGVVYTLVISKLQNYSPEKITPSFINLKEYLLSYIEDGDTLKLVCLDDCSECTLYRDGVKVKVIKSFFDANIKKYRYDFLQGTIQKREIVFFNTEGIQENVCFSFAVYKNAVAEQVVVVYDDKAYDYSTYFSKTKKFDSLSEALLKQQKLQEEVMR